jgi:peroxisomal trans-2-enoyl-CoA reductase
MAATHYSPTLFCGKVAVVTGGGSGIGFAIARDLLGLGCTVVIASRKEEKLREAAQQLRAAVPGSCVAHERCNIREEKDVAALMQRVLERHGRLDALVNNGGGQFPSAAKNVRKKGWSAVVETNLTGTFLCSREAYTQWMEAHGGAIVNIVCDMWTGFPGLVHTGAARAGVVNMTSTLAVEWASAGVRVNTVAPGVIYSASAAANYPSPDFLTATARHSPAQRLGTPEEVSAAVLFLLSPLASFVTGETLRVDGGNSLFKVPWHIPPHASMPPFAGDAGPPPSPEVEMPIISLAKQATPPPRSKL